MADNIGFSLRLTLIQETQRVKELTTALHVVPFIDDLALAPLLQLSSCYHGSPYD